MAIWGIFEHQSAAEGICEYGKNGAVDIMANLTKLEQKNELAVDEGHVYNGLYKSYNISNLKYYLEPHGRDAKDSTR